MANREQQSDESRGIYETDEGTQVFEHDEDAFDSSRMMPERNRASDEFESDSDSMQDEDL